jgi:protease II
MTRPSTVALLALAGLVLTGASPLPTPPVAPRKDHVQVWHGRSFGDPYYWLREKGSPDVVKYLESENAYTEATTADLQPSFELAWMLRQVGITK